MKTAIMVLAFVGLPAVAQNKPAVTKTAVQSASKPKPAGCPVKLGTDSNMTLSGPI